MPTSADMALIPHGTTTNLTGVAAVYGLTASGTLALASSSLTVSATTTLEASASLTSSNSVLTFNGGVTSTGSLTLTSGNALFSDIFNNYGTYHVGSGYTTTSATVLNEGTFALDTGTLVVRSYFDNNGTFTPGTGTVVLHNSSNASARGFGSEAPISFQNVIVRGTNDTFFSHLATRSTASVNGTITVESGTLGVDGVVASGTISVASRLYNNGLYSPFIAYSTTTFSGSGYFYGRQGSTSTFYSDVVFGSGATGGFDLSMSGNDGDHIFFYKRLLTSSDTYFTPGNYSTAHFAATTTAQTIPSGYTFDHLAVTNANGVTLLGNTDVNDTLTVSGALDLGGNVLTISGEDDPITVTGEVNFDSSTVRFDANGSVNVPSLAYWNLTTSSTDATIVDTVTTTHTFTNLGTLTVANGKRLYAPTFVNTGTITETGSIIHAAGYARLTDADGTIQTAFNGDAPSVYVTVHDDDANLNGSAVDTIASGTLVLVTGFGDTVIPTLRETAVGSGIFRAGPFPIRLASGASAGDTLDAIQTGTVTLSFVDDKDGTDTGSASATFRLTDRGGGAVSLEPDPPLGPRAPSPSASRAALDFRINRGEATTSDRRLTITLHADPATVRGYALSLDAAFAQASQFPYQESVAFDLPNVPGTYRLHLRYYSRSGHASETITREIRYAPTTADTERPSSLAPRFTRTLIPGSRGEDVRRLARFLNENGFPLASRGPGSRGAETTYFGPLLARALTRFQEAHAAKILAPLGLSRGTGTFGPSTRALINGQHP